jgi:tetratricopeptide (TPR) repeat protein
MLGVLIVLVAQAASPSGANGAWSSARPPECAPLDGGKANNIWERAKAPELRRYCDLLASGASKLAGSAAMAKDVVAIADEAEHLLAGKAAPSVLKGRALTQLGDHAEAYKLLADAKSKDDRALDDPHALLAWARVLVRTGHAAEAADAYRALLPRASMLTLADRSAASLEAGMLAMARGASALDEAVPIFRQSVRDSQDIAQIVSALSLALALDRAGDKDEARAMLAERVHGDPRPVLASARAKDLLGPAGAPEAPALVAIALEISDPAAARAEWQRYVEAASGAKGPWIDHARAHEAALSGKKPPSKPSRPKVP